MEHLEQQAQDFPSRVPGFPRRDQPAAGPPGSLPAGGGPGGRGGGRGCRMPWTCTRCLGRRTPVSCGWARRKWLAQMEIPGHAGGPGGRAAQVRAGPPLSPPTTVSALSPQTAQISKAPSLRGCQMPLSQRPGTRSQRLIWLCGFGTCTPWGLSQRGSF